MLNLLTHAGEGGVDLVFAGGADPPRLCGDRCRLEDLGEAWPTALAPGPCRSEEAEGSMTPPEAALSNRFDPAPAAGQTTKLILALPKGRILEEVDAARCQRAGIEPEPAFFDPDTPRSSASPPAVPEFEIILVRSFDVATFVAFGAARSASPAATC